MIVSTLLEEAKEKLKDYSVNPTMDAENILSSIIGHSVEFISRWPNTPVTIVQKMSFYNRIDKFLSGIPLAYILGKKKFMNIELILKQGIFVPRAESEYLAIKIMKLLEDAPNSDLLELGTGCGALSLSLAHSRPDFKIVAIDKSSEAISLAKRNARRLEIENIFFNEISFAEFFSTSRDKFNIIFGNPPYASLSKINEEKLIENGFVHEPLDTLISGEDGLEYLTFIINNSKNHLKDNGILVLEHDPSQTDILKKVLSDCKFSNINTVRIDGYVRIIYASTSLAG